MKKTQTISIDTEVLKKAKKQIPNISAFVEECMKQYLGIGNNLIPTSKIHEINETISKCNLKLHILTSREHMEETKQKAEKQEINLAWRLLFKDYRNTRQINKDRLEHAIKVLNISEEELIDIVEVAYAFYLDSDVDITEWNEVYNEWGY